MQLTAPEYETIVDVLNDPMPDYSGRGMFGRTCFAVVGGQEDFEDAVESVSGIKLSEWADTEYLTEELAAFQRELRSTVRTDSLGMDTVFYWPSITVEQ